MRIVSTEHVEDRLIEKGEFVYAVAISGANIIRDMRETITNTIGGHMTRYEDLCNQTLDRALASLKEKAAATGYDGVLGVRIEHPAITQGAVSVVVFGTGFRYRD
ncbi:MAG TPA: heavy metal-binding domain-containing protein [Hyphomicrobiaceae bacterium]|nr:heavy metal-binding domain-containing protein [Hyphomicrobiaceae bacterium]